MIAPGHGSSREYALGCRCRPCDRAMAIVVKWRSEQERRYPQGRLPHGTADTYWRHGCRCRPCREAYARATRR